MNPFRKAQHNADKPKQEGRSIDLQTLLIPHAPTKETTPQAASRHSGPNGCSSAKHFRIGRLVARHDRPERIDPAEPEVRGESDGAPAEEPGGVLQPFQAAPEKA